MNHKTVSPHLEMDNRKHILMKAKGCQKVLDNPTMKISVFPVSLRLAENNVFPCFYFVMLAVVKLIRKNHTVQIHASLKNTFQLNK